MIGRIRDVKTRQLCIYIAPGRANVPVTRENIRAILCHRRQDLMREYDTTLLTFTIGRYGKFELVETNYLALWIENTLVQNQSRGRFADIFVGLAREGGAACTVLDELQVFVLTTTSQDELIRAGELAIADHKEKKAELSQARAVAIAAAEEINPATASEIKQAISLQQEVDAQSKYSYEKYKLRAGYKYLTDMTPQFVITYISPQVKQIYSNLVRVVSAMNDLAEAPPTYDRALDLIQRAERELMLRSGLESPVEELNNSYSYSKHRAAHLIARACGWQSPFVHEFRAPIEVYNSLGDNYWTVIPGVCLEFGARMPTRQQCAGVDAETATALMIKPLSFVLNSVYGVTIAASAGSLYLKPHSAFKIMGPPGDQTIALTKG
jgi:hypothetical protein